MKLRRLWDRYPAIRWAVIIGVIGAALAAAILLAVAGPPDDRGAGAPDPAAAAGTYAAWSD